MKNIGVIKVNNKYFGTGFIIDYKNKLIVSATHVIENALEGNEIHEIRLKLFFSNIELEILNINLKLDSKEEDIIFLEYLYNPHINDDKIHFSYDYTPTKNVYALGYCKENFENISFEREYKTSQGKISGITKYKNINYIELDIKDIYKGMSGAPVMTEEGKIIGVLTDRIVTPKSSTALIIPIDSIINKNLLLTSPLQNYFKDLLESTNNVYSIVEVKKYIDIPLECNDTEKNIFTNIIEIIQKNKNFIILGESGSGKTQTLLRVLRFFCNKYETYKKIPIFVNLSSWGKEQRINDFIINSIKLKNYDEYYFLDSYKKIISNKNIIFLFDELDQLNGRQSLELKEWLKNNGLNFIITCKNSSYTGSRLFNVKEYKIKALSLMLIYKFAKEYLSNEKKYEYFIKQFNTDFIKSNLVELVKIPLFLVLFLENYKMSFEENKEKIFENISLYSLFELYIRLLWEKPHISVLYQKNSDFERKYSNKEFLIKKLSEIAILTTNKKKVYEDDILSIIDKNLLTILLESNLIQFDSLSKQFYFPHSLFANFYISTNLDSSNLHSLINDDNWLMPILIFSTKNPEAQQYVEKITLKQLRNNLLSTQRDNYLNIIGIIGSFESLKELTKIINENGFNYEIQKTIAKIVNRLPEKAKERSQFITKLIKEMKVQFSKLKSIDDFAMIDNFWNCEKYAMILSYINSLDSLEGVLWLLEESAVYYNDKLFSGSIIRLNDFSNILSSYGDWSIPILFNMLYSKNYDVGNSIASALLKMNRPFDDIEEIGEKLLSNPNPEVRSKLALILGKNGDIQAIKYLKKAITDGGVYSFGGLLIPYIHYFVCDDVAFAISLFRNEDSNEILLENDYDSNGIPSTNLLLNRLKSGFDIVSNREFDSLRIQISAKLLLLPELNIIFKNMGYLENPFPEELYIEFPISKAIIIMSFADEFLPYFKRKDFKDDLYQFTRTTKDLINKKIGLITLARINCLDSIELIKETIFKNQNNFELFSSACLSYVYLLIKNENLINNVLDEIITYVLSTLKQIKLYNENLTDFFYHLLCLFENEKYKERNERFLTLLKENITYINVIEAIEKFKILNNNEIFDQIYCFQNSFSYYHKLGDVIYNDILLSEYNFNRTETNINEQNINTAINYFEKSYNLLANHIINSIKTKEEKNFQNLFSISHICLKIAKLYVIKEESKKALFWLEKVKDNINNQKRKKFEIYLEIYACSEISNYLYNDEFNNEEYAFENYIKAYQLSKEFSIKDWQFSHLRLLPVFLQATRSTIKYLQKDGSHEVALEIGLYIINLFSQVNHYFYEEFGSIFILLIDSFDKFVDEEDIILFAKKGLYILQKSLNTNLVVSSFFSVISYAISKNVFDVAQSLINKALEITKRELMEEQIASLYGLYAFTINNDRFNEKKSFLLKAKKEFDNLVFYNKSDYMRIIHELALLYLYNEQYNKSEYYFKETLNILENNKDIVKEAKYYIISDYCILFNKTGRKEEAIEKLLILIKEIIQNDLEIDYPYQILNRIDTLPNGNISFTTVKSWLEPLELIKNKKIPIGEINTYYKNIWEYTFEKKWYSENNLISAIIELLNNPKKNVILKQENPYNLLLEDIKNILK